MVVWLPCVLLSWIVVIACCPVAVIGARVAPGGERGDEGAQGGIARSGVS
jgi:hypothetical protein